MDAETREAGDGALLSLDLSRNALKCSGVETLCLEGLAGNGTLEVLRLEAVGMGMDAPAALAHVLSKWYCQIRHLCVAGNRICGERAKKNFNPQPVHTLLDALTGQHEPAAADAETASDAWHRRHRPTSALLGMEPRPRNVALRSIDFSMSDIGARSAKRLFEVLVDNPRITSVDITDCNITEVGSGHVFTHITHCALTRTPHTPRRTYSGGRGSRGRVFAAPDWASEASHGG